MHTGEFVTATFKMPPGWAVRLCIVAGLTPVEVPQCGSGKFPKVRVLQCMRLRMVNITLLGYTCTNCSVVTTYYTYLR